MSKLVANGNSRESSRLVKSFELGLDQLKDYTLKPDGVFGITAKIICGDVTLESSELDFEFSIPFDDDMETNEGEIIIYNLTSNTIKKLKHKSEISIEAGYIGDTGVIFKGFITKVSTKRDGADKKTVIKCADRIVSSKLVEIPFKAGTKASYILKTLLKSYGGFPIAVFKVRRDWTYKDEQKVDGDAYEAIKKYSEVCGVSTYVSKGKIYCRYIKEGDNINFTVSADTGLIGSPEPYEEEVSAEDYKDVIKGYEVEMLFQHRIAAGSIVKLKSLSANGTYRVCSGEHKFNPDECITKIKMY